MFFVTMVVVGSVFFVVLEGTPMSSDEQPGRFQEQVSLLLDRQKTDLEDVFNLFNAAEVLIGDEFALSRLITFGLSANEASCLVRWARNTVQAQQAGLPDFTLVDIHRLGVVAQESVLRFGVVFQNYYVVANSRPSDLTGCIPGMALDEARMIVQNARTAHYRKATVFYVGPDSVHTFELPPYNGGTMTVPQYRQQIIDLLKHIQNSIERD